MLMTLMAPKRQTIQRRTNVATAQLRDLIGADDVKLLSAAIIQAAAAEAMRNAAFRASVRRIYEELRTQPLSTARTQRSNRQSTVEPVPLPGMEGARFDPFAPLDPYALLRLYGSQQLGAALAGYSSTALREAVSVVRQKHPKTKPKDARKAESLIAYIVQQLTGVQ